MVVKVISNKRRIFLSLVWVALFGLGLNYLTAVFTLRIPRLTNYAFISILLIGFLMGIGSQFLIKRRTWAPKLTWLMLAFFFWVFSPLGGLLSGLMVGFFFRFTFSLPMQLMSQLLLVLGPLLAFGLWLLVGYFSLVALSKPATKARKNADKLWFNSRLIIALTGMLIIVGVLMFVLFVSASLGLFMTILSLAFLIILAVYGTSSRMVERRSVGFIVLLWFFPAFTFLGLTVNLLKESL